MTPKQLKAHRENAEKIRDQYAAARPLIKQSVAQERDRLKRKHGQHATPGMLRDDERVRRVAEAKRLREAREQVLSPKVVAELEQRRAALNDPSVRLQYRMRQWLPAPPAERIIGDLYLSNNELARLQGGQHREILAELQRQRFEQSTLSRLRPAELAALAAVAATADDKRTVDAVHLELRNRPGTPNNLASEIETAKRTVGTLVQGRDDAELAEEIADLDATLQAVREAAQSEHAIATGSELGLVAESVREIREATVAGIPDAGAMVAAEHTARRHGQPAPQRPAPFAIPISAKQTTEPTTKTAA